MSNLISTPNSAQLQVLCVGAGAQELARLLNLTPGSLEESDLALFLVSAKDGLTPTEQESWLNAREHYIPSLVVITDLLESEIDFDDMSAIAGRLLDPVVTPYLVLHSEEGAPAALIQLDSLKIHEISNGEHVVRESDPEHKLLVFEFRKEYLEAMEAAGEGAFEQGLLYPALPWVSETGLGVQEIAEYLSGLPSRG